MIKSRPPTEAGDAMSPALFSLFLATFCIGTTEFMIAGLLPEIARDLETSIPRAGYLVTGYALGVAIGGPLVSLITSRFPRKAMLLSLMSGFIAGHVVGAFAPNYPMLMMARILISLTHGCFFGLAAVMAISLVGEGQRGRALALVIAGFSVANVLGAPGGAAIGNLLGWRATFWAVAALSVFSLLLMARYLQGSGGREAGRHRLGAQVRVLGRQAVVTSFLLIVLMMIAVFSTYTYIAPSLVEVSGFQPETVPWLLLAFGLGATLGVFLGGRLADTMMEQSLLLGFPIQLATFAGLYFLSGSQLAMAALLFVYGLVNFGMSALLQSRIMAAAASAPDLTSTLISSVFNLGIAVGASIGAVALGHGVPYADLPLIGAGLSVVCCVLVTVAVRLDRQAVQKRAIPD